MDSDNFYYKIYQRKSTNELNEVIVDTNAAIDTRLTAIKVLEDRGEFNKDFSELKITLDQQRVKLLTDEVSDDKYDTFSARFGANIIDGLFLRLIGFVLVHLNTSESLFVISPMNMIILFFPYLYTILLQGFTGQTIGKMFMGIKIFDKGELVKISFMQAVLRDIVPLGLTFALYLLFSPLVLSDGSESVTLSALSLLYILAIWSIVEIISLLFNKKRRALHDFIAGTVVLNIKDR
jgi:uncharacterized RDD family membrane protein YckC